jgi:exopolysaccharide biosynthesis polyprenyl glycosylphosphotransferase
MMTNSFTEGQFPIISAHGTPVICIPQRLTVLEAVDFKTTCHQLVERLPHSKQIILDFSQTKFIDSSGIGALVHNLKATREKGISLVLYEVHPQVMAVLSMTGLDTILEIKSHVPAAQSAQKSDVQLPETHPSVQSRVKRLVDIVGSLVGLLLTAIIFIPIALAIKWESPGPILFEQTRCGWLGKRFKILKFRSMCVNAEELKDKITNQAQGAFFKNRDDPRITRVGRFLRRTSLDEFPQFWNVLKGEMSLVGTRPPTPDEVERYEVPQWQRLNVKPGMTGEWQVNGRSQVKNFEDVITLDLRYQENWSLIYDFQLIFKTILILFNHKSGAF